ncbi:MAG: helix-turn-helix transcriptional regulator [Lachnospiraceae bacterium]|nr:helix-turn-helix transcriptional regulator [Lachnospiraceae bacterium]
MSETVHIGRILKDRRESLHLSQREVAHESNMSTRGVEKIEHGDTVPNWKSILRISGVLRMNLGDLNGCLDEKGHDS